MFIHIVIRTLPRFLDPEDKFIVARPNTGNYLSVAPPKHPSRPDSSLTLLSGPRIFRVTGTSQVSLSYKNDNHVNRNLIATVARILFVTMHTICIAAVWDIFIKGEALYIQNLY